MLQLNFLEFVFRVIPESFMITYGIILLSEEKNMSIWKYFLSGICMSINAFCVRLLPISFGVHIIINIILDILIITFIRIKLIKAIYSTLTMFLILSLSEFINIYVLGLMNIDFNTESINIFKKLLLGIPSLIIMVVFIFIIKLLLKKNMSITEKLAFKLGNMVKTNLNTDSDETDIIIYGAINLFQTINSILWVIIVGFFTGALYETLLFSITASILRKYSGGVHASSPMRCTIIGAVSSGIFGGFINRFFYKSNINIVIIFSVLLIIISLLIILKKAPVDSIQKPIDDDSMKKSFRKKSILLIFIITFITISLLLVYIVNRNVIYIKLIECLIIGTFWQSFTLTKMGDLLVTKIDLGLKFLIEGR